MSNRDRAERIVHALSQYLTVRVLVARDVVANPEEAIDESEEYLVREIEKCLNEVVADAIEP